LLEAHEPIGQVVGRSGFGDAPFHVEQGDGESHRWSAIGSASLS